MSEPQAFVIKYMPDMKRREPRNIGVVVTDGDQILSRFLGEDSTGDLKPLNSVPRLFESRRTYRSWWQHWQRTIVSGDADPESLPRLLVPEVGSNYVCELGATHLAGAALPLSDFLESMWTELVADGGTTEGPGEDEIDLVEASDQLVSPYELRPGYEVFRDRSLPVAHRTRDGRSFEAKLYFHYMIKNGRWNHMRRLKLSNDDVGTWDRVHMTVRHFEGLNESPDAAHRDSNKIALVLIGPKNTEAEQQLQELERKITVVPVDDLRRAEDTLGALLGR